MTRSPSPYGWRQYREVRRRFIIRNVWLLVALFGLVAATLILQAQWAHGYVLGLLQGSFVIVMAAKVRSQFWAHTGAFSLLIGGQGEDDTRAELQTAVRSGGIFGWVDSIELERCDIDHLVASPAGWYAIDTKWRSRSLTQTDLDRDAASAGRAARKAHFVLRAHGVAASVRPAVVVWGGAATTLPEEGVRHASGVQFVSGRHLLGWLGEQPQHEPLTRSEADKLLAQLIIFRSKYLTGGKAA
jgi:hypothetical protein